MTSIIHKIVGVCKVVATQLSARTAALLGLKEEETVREYARMGVVVGVGILCFGLGSLQPLHVSRHTPMLDTNQRVPYLDYNSPQGSASEGQKVNALPVPEGAKYVASKQGKKYHALWCPGARTISEKNKRYFTTPEEARAAGYAAASNCPGIK